MYRFSAIFSSVLITSVPCFAQWTNYPTARIPRGPDGKPNLSAPAPKTSDGKPDLSGVWQAESQEFFFDLASGLKPEDVMMVPGAKALQQRRVAREHGDDPLARCLPHGVPRINTNGLFPFKIVQTPAVVVILYEQLNLFRQVFLDGRKLVPDPNPAWLGYSTGHWDGDTLVIETSGFNDKTWLDTTMGRPASEALHVIERVRRPNFGTLEVRATIDDPKTYEKPWTSKIQKMNLQLDTDILEFICNENEKDQSHMPGK
ncbi:MAG TPA: hypothetical protein VKT49_01255 [Bryobacteraceae bacterium]|nr:hypothetical protein [Bryobacteraceae bacterium]